MVQFKAMQSIRRELGQTSAPGDMFLHTKFRLQDADKVTYVSHVATSSNSVTYILPRNPIIISKSGGTEPEMNRAFVAWHCVWYPALSCKLYTNVAKIKLVFNKHVSIKMSLKIRRKTNGSHPSRQQHTLYSIKFYCATNTRINYCPHSRRKSLLGMRYTRMRNISRQVTSCY
jgi:hypothetical protein